MVSKRILLSSPVIHGEEQEFIKEAYHIKEIVLSAPY